MTTQEQHYQHSSYREKLLEHLFLAELLQVGWFKNPQRRVAVVRPEVDDSGYDLLLECSGVRRYVHLKSTSRIAVNIRLATKPGGCVIKLNHKFVGERVNLKYRFFGKGPNDHLDLGDEPGIDPKTKKPILTNRKLYIRDFCKPTDINKLFDKLSPGGQPG